MNSLSSDQQENVVENRGVTKLKIMFNQWLYKYNYTYIPSVAMLKSFFYNENPPFQWWHLVVQAIVTMLFNRFSNNFQSDEKLIEEEIEKEYPKFVSILALPLSIALFLIATIRLSFSVYLFKNFREILLRIVPVKSFVVKLVARILSKASALSTVQKSVSVVLDQIKKEGHVENLQSYENLFSKIKLPKIAKNFQTDEVFAYMRVAGYNPVMIERVEQLPENFPLSETQYQEVMGDEDSLTAAIQAGRLYLADYKALAGAANGTYPKEQKYLYAPLALFAVPKTSDSSRLMRPVAIQCSQDPDDTPIVTPKSSKYAWLCAKTIVQVADANFHEALSHLGRTHLFVGRFAIATHRQLPNTHPLSLLLLPHFEGTLNINHAAQGHLISPQGGVDALLASTIDNSRAFVEADLAGYSFNKAMLPEQLKARRVDDVEKLPIYPYRDDALLIWDAIHQWVSEYLNIYYQNNEEVKNDAQLQNWAQEVVAYDGARVYDFGEGENGSIHTRDYLVNATTLIIFTASAQHAAVNFPQKDFMTYAPAVPMAGYQPVSILKNPEVSEQDYFNLLPPIEQAQSQLDLTYVLGSVHYTQLGHYQKNHFKDHRVQTALKQFKDNLKDIGDKIKQRNQNYSRQEYPLPYKYLIPGKIPQSINI